MNIPGTMPHLSAAIQAILEKHGEIVACIMLQQVRLKNLANNPIFAMAVHITDHVIEDITFEMFLASMRLAKIEDTDEIKTMISNVCDAFTKDCEENHAKGTPGFVKLDGPTSEPLKPDPIAMDTAKKARITAEEMNALNNLDDVNETDQAKALLAQLGIGRPNLAG